MAKQLVGTVRVLGDYESITIYVGSDAWSIAEASRIGRELIELQQDSLGIAESYKFHAVTVEYRLQEQAEE